MKPIAVEAFQSPGTPMYANCPKCHTQNTMKWEQTVKCCACGTPMTVNKATLRETQFTRTAHAGFGSPSVAEIR